MKSLFRSPRALVYAVLVHLFVIAVIVFSMDWSAFTDKPKPAVKIVEAVAVDEKKIEKQIQNLKDQERRKKLAEDQRQKKLDKEAQDAKRARELEEKRLADTKKQNEDEKKQLADLQKKQAEEQKNQQALETKRKETEKKLAEAQKERARIEKEAEKRAKEDRLNKMREEEDRQRMAAIAAEEDQRKKRQEAEAAERKRQMDAEAQKLAAEGEVRAQTEVEKYMALIREKIEHNWRLPLIVKPGSKCTVAVRMIPGGDVIHVETIKSSGDPAFDRSVEAAVHKAVPLPLPADTNLFERFRDLELVFSPENIQ